MPSLWTAKRLLTSDGMLNQTWNKLVRRVQQTIEVVRCVNHDPNVLFLGNIVRIKKGDATPYAIEICPGAFPLVDDFLGVVIEDNILPGQSCTVRTANVAEVLMVAGLGGGSTPFNGMLVYVDQGQPGRGTTVSANGWYKVGRIIDPLDYNAVDKLRVKIELRYCCTAQPV